MVNYPENLKFYYNNLELSVADYFSYLVVDFKPGGSFSLAQASPKLISDEMVIYVNLETFHPILD